MRRLLTFAAFTAILAFPATVSAADDSDAPTPEELARILKTIIASQLPNPLYQQDFDWGKQEMVTVGVRWEKKGIFLVPEAMKKLHNDGKWRKIQVTANQPDKSLELTVSNVKLGADGKLTFDVSAALPIDIKFEQQLWKAGVRLYSGETRARAKAVLNLTCEASTRVEKNPKSILPDLFMRFRVLKAKSGYEKLVVEHTAGFGGDAAKFLGEGVIETVRTCFPSIERKLLEKADAAILKKGDTKEIKIALSK